MMTNVVFILNAIKFVDTGGLSLVFIYMYRNLSYFNLILEFLQKKNPHIFLISFICLSCLHPPFFLTCQIYFNLQLSCNTRPEFKFILKTTFICFKGTAEETGKETPICWLLPRWLQHPRLAWPKPEARNFFQDSHVVLGAPQLGSFKKIFFGTLAGIWVVSGVSKTKMGAHMGWWTWQTLALPAVP